MVAYGLFIIRYIEVIILHITHTSPVRKELVPNKVLLILRGWINTMPIHVAFVSSPFIDRYFQASLIKKVQPPHSPGSYTLTLNIPLRVCSSLLLWKSRLFIRLRCVTYMLDSLCHPYLIIICKKLNWHMSSLVRKSLITMWWTARPYTPLLLS